MKTERRESVAEHAADRDKSEANGPKIPALAEESRGRGGGEERLREPVGIGTGLRTARAIDPGSAHKTSQDGNVRNAQKSSAPFNWQSEQRFLPEQSTCRDVYSRKLVTSSRGVSGERSRFPVTAFARHLAQWMVTCLTVSCHRRTVQCRTRTNPYQMLFPEPS